MRYLPTQGTPLPYGLILALYYRTSPEEVSLRYAVEWQRRPGDEALTGIVIRDLEEGSETLLPVESLESEALGPGLIAFENLSGRHTFFNILEDLFITRGIRKTVEEGGRYFSVFALMNESTPGRARAQTGVLARRP